MAVIRSRFCRGVVRGTTMRPGTPRCRQLKATPWAWLPALAHTMPWAFSSADIWEIRLKAPRSL